MSKDLIILGSGNFDLIRLIIDINKNKPTFNLLGFTDINKDLWNKEIYGYPILGDDSIIERREFKNALIVNNIYFSQEVRLKTYEQFNKYKERFCNIIHPTVNTKYVEIGIGNIIYDNVVIQSGVKINDYNIIYSSSVISHETEIGSNCLVSVNVSIGARNKIGNFCLFGISSCTLPSLEICDFSFIGAGSVVIKNLKANSKVFGNPAKLIP